MSNETITCEFCKKSFLNLSNLKYHQKTAKYCLKLQNKDTNKLETYDCKHCKKEFLNKTNYEIHLTRCKERKNIEENNMKNELEKYKKENSELKIKLDYEKKKVIELEKQLKQFNKTQTINTNCNNNNNNINITNYTIQFEQLFKLIVPFTEENIKNRIQSITDEVIQTISNNDVSNSVSTSIIKSVKDFTFCTDASRKIFVVKDEDEKSQKLTASEFLKTYIKVGLKEFNEYLDKLSEFIEDQYNRDLVTDDERDYLANSLIKIRNFVNDIGMNMSSKNNPLKDCANLLVTNIQQLVKARK